MSSSPSNQESRRRCNRRIIPCQDRSTACHVHAPANCEVPTSSAAEAAPCRRQPQRMPHCCRTLIAASAYNSIRRRRSSAIGLVDDEPESLQDNLAERPRRKIFRPQIRPRGDASGNATATSLVAERKQRKRCLRSESFVRLRQRNSYFTRKRDSLEFHCHTYLPLRSPMYSVLCKPGAHSRVP